MKFLILGSSGQIGYALKKYIKKEHDALGFDMRNTPAEDLRIPSNAILREMMGAADFVFFLAFDVGGSHYLRSYQNTFEFISNNARIMENTFSCLKETKKPFIFISSQMSNMSHSPYGILKSIGECYTKTLNGLIVKCWNVYGVEQDTQKNHVITDFILKARKNKIIDMLTDGTEQRQLLYVNDCCDCLLTLANKYDYIPRDKKLDVTSFKWHTIISVAKIIADIYPGTKIKPAKATDELQRCKKNEPDPYVLQFWRPKTSLEEGISKINMQLELD